MNTKNLCTLLITLLFSSSVPAEKPRESTGSIKQMTRKTRLFTGYLWDGKYDYAIGFDSSSSSLGVFGQNAVVFGLWKESIGYEFLLGYTKSANTASETVTTNTDVLANSQTIATAYGGSKSQHSISLGTVARFQFFQNSWLMIYGGAVGGVILTPKSTVRTGTVTETIADIDSPTNKTVSEASLGTVTNSTALQILVGPKLGAEVYLKWFPQVAVGFGTGLVATLGGNTTRTTSTATRAYSVVSGTEQTPTSSTTSSSSVVTRPGLRGTTFGLGGTTFQFIGTFTVRYVW